MAVTGGARRGGGKREGRKKGRKKEERSSQCVTGEREGGGIQR